MSKKIPTGAVLGPKAMEQVMRDVLSGMEDLAIMKSFESINNVFEIVSILPSEHEQAHAIKRPLPQKSADIIPLPDRQHPD